MAKLTLNAIGSRYGSIDALNDNFDAIEQALENTLSRDGTSPNALEADLDMNSNSILNANTIHASALVIGGQTLEPGDAVATATVQVFEFTATAGQTSFSVSPLTPASSSVLVEVNGLSLPTSSLVTSGSTLSFPALTLGDEVVVKVFTRDIGAYPAITNNEVATNAAIVSSKLAFTQAGTSAVTRTAQDKMREVVSVKDFGAVGDGITNDTGAIQAAITAATGKTLLFTDGATYKVTFGLTVPANTVLIGYGATLSCTGSQFNVITFVNGGACFGLTLVGPASGTYNANGIAIVCAGTNNAPSAPTYVNAPIIRDCAIRNFGMYGVYFAYVNGGLVEGCKISGIGYTGVGGVSCNDTIVTGNDIATIGPGPGTGDAYGVFLDRNNGTSETAEPRSYRCSMTNNDVRAVVATGGVNGQGLDTHAGVDFVFADNRITGCQVGIAVTASVISGTPQLAPKRVTVSGNIINGLSVGYGILLSGALNGSTVNEYAEQVTVENNVILNHGATNDALNGGIVLQATKGCVVSGNTLRNSRSVGINLNLENLGVNVTSNTITDPHDNTFSAPVCLRVTGNNITGLISNNTFVFENAALNTFVAVESIRVATSLTGLSLTIGQGSFVGLSATRLTYSELTSTGVNASTLMVQRGQAAVALTNASSNALAVTFSQRFPMGTPRVQLTRNGTPVPGTVAKSPILESSLVAADTFTIVARPYDLTTFGGAGTINVDWIATT